MNAKPPYALIAQAAQEFTKSAVTSKVLLSVIQHAHEVTDIPYVVSGDTMTVVRDFIEKAEDVEE